MKYHPSNNLVYLMLVPLIEVRVEMALLVERFPAEGAGPL